MFQRIISFFYYKTSFLKGLIFLALFVFFSVSFLTYHYSDPSFNRATHANIQNLFGFYGAYISDPLLQFFGFANIAYVMAFFFWSMGYFFYERVRYIYFRFVCMLLSIVTISTFLSVMKVSDLWLFSSYGGYFGVLIQKYFLLFIPLDLLVISSLVLSVLFSHFSLGINLYGWKKFFLFLRSVFLLFYKLIRKVFLLIKLLLSKITFASKKDLVENLEPEKTKKIQVLSPKKVHKKTIAPVLSDSNNFEFPPLDLLSEVKDQKSVISANVIKKSTEDLQIVLEDFGIKGEIIEVHTGPVVTLYELEPAAGTKSSRVIGLADDISRSMKAHAARIAVIPGRNAIGIELPNKKREIIYLRELLESEQYKSGEQVLPLVLGKDISGKPIIVDLTRMPHLLVAGTTGSGKSVSINTMILSLLYSRTPEECKVIMIDPKMLELSIYDGIPHLLTPVVTEPKKAITALKWVVKEMEERYRKMSNIGVRSIAAYNAKIEEAKIKGQELSRNVQTGFDNETGRPVIEKVMLEMKNLPFIVVIVDEMADLMIVAGKEIETSIQRLSQMARAAGIHIIMATQRPSVDVITGVIKANFPTRISFSVTSRIDSRTILGEQGAEQLLGMGDMLYMGNGSKIVRVHGPYVADEEVRNVVEFLKTQGEPEYIDNVTIEMEESGFDEGGESGGGEDSSLYAQAVDIVARDRKASTSYIQRCLRIGYNRAASIIDRMEKEGIVSSANHVGKREVLISER